MRPDASFWEDSEAGMQREGAVAINREEDDGERQNERS